MSSWRKQDGLIEELAAGSTDNTVNLPLDFFREAFMNDAAVLTARWAYDRLSPDPYRLLTEPLDICAFESLAIPRSWLMGTEDVVLPPGERG